MLGVRPGIPAGVAGLYGGSGRSLFLGMMVCCGFKRLP
ncbi:hypothetical protein TREPR_2093 [Treponema primitia ZAS-2]|uniref:Uncharacterized protein n=1 Tax=Treponema primitia (strain ATCC BAA-887 / DSM 12427 / ZAS-2) TaxID=545694 RepID=F5YJP8_TREPZ|nr:hypothetical protein TREPR_2093 [Treponema primitia ZAS-2]